MKSSDWALVIFIAALSTVLAYWIGGMVLGNPSERFENVSYANSLSGEVLNPDGEMFNSTVRNPTVEIVIGECKSGERWDDAQQSCVRDDSDVVNDENHNGNGGNNNGGNNGGGSSNGGDGDGNGGSSNGGDGDGNGGSSNGGGGGDGDNPQTKKQ